MKTINLKSVLLTASFLFTSYLAVLIILVEIMK